MKLTSKCVFLLFEGIYTTSYIFHCSQLLTKITEAQQDKEKLAIDLEREEECLTNNLQRQLRKISIEKEETDAEVDDLKRQLEDMKTEREKVSD